MAAAQRIRRGVFGERRIEHRKERRGYTVSLPPGWHLAKRSLTPSLVDPVEMLEERAHAARGDPTFPRRPATFKPDPRLPGTSTLPYCLRGDRRRPIPMLDYWFGFRDAGRAFHVFVGVGKEAPEEVQEEAFGILQSLRLDRNG